MLQKNMIVRQHLRMLRIDCWMHIPKLHLKIGLMLFNRKREISYWKTDEYLYNEIEVDHEVTDENDDYIELI